MVLMTSAPGEGIATHCAKRDKSTLFGCGSCGSCPPTVLMASPMLLPLLTEASSSSSTVLTLTPCAFACSRSRLYCA